MYSVLGRSFRLCQRRTLFRSTRPSLAVRAAGNAALNKLRLEETLVNSQVVSASTGTRCRWSEPVLLGVNSALFLCGGAITLVSSSLTGLAGLSFFVPTAFVTGCGALGLYISLPEFRGKWKQCPLHERTVAFLLFAVTFFASAYLLGVLAVMTLIVVLLDD